MPTTVIDEQGKEKEIDLLEIVPINEAVVNMWYGKIRSGKTYAATAQAIEDLNNGNVVYTSWRIKWEGLDERKNKWNLWKGKFGFKKEFKVFPKENWHYLPFDGVEKDLSYYKPYTNFLDKFLSLTDCIVYLDEGQIPLNSYEKTTIRQEKQNAILFTGHFNRSINIISQRPIQIHPILRANISRFYKVEKTEGTFGGISFKRYEYQDTDANSLPDENKEPISVEEYDGKEEIFAAYNSKYMRGDIKNSQENLAKVYELNKSQAKITLDELKRKIKEEKLNNKKND